MITKPQNVLVMRDVACSGYVAGCNTQWFAKPAGRSSGGWSLQTAQTAMMARLSFADDVGAKYASMLAFPCYAEQFESGHLDTVMSVTTRLLPWEVTTASGGNHTSFPGGEFAYKAYSGRLNLRSVHFGEDMKASTFSPLLHPLPPPYIVLSAAAQAAENQEFIRCCWLINNPCARSV